MNEHINLFDTTAEFESAYTLSAYTEPWLSYTKEDRKVKYEKTPLTFGILSAGTILWKVAGNSSFAKTIQFKINRGPWISVTSTSAGIEIPVQKNDIVKFKGNNGTYGSGTSVYNTFSGSTAKFNVFGNIMSLTGDIQQTSIAYKSRIFMGIFRGCKNLISAKNLILPSDLINAVGCFDSMFYNCTNLKKAPNLSHQSHVPSYGYRNMFYHCTSLVVPPELPTDTGSTGVYSHQSMFSGCVSLKTAPTLASKSVYANCYENMFYGCTSLIEAPDLPATSIDEKCYKQMFDGCTSLKKAPSILPATTLDTWCYFAMFRGCTSLTTAPVLPATTLANDCYENMFDGCTSLKKASDLPATILNDACYKEMFIGCTSLTTAPILPAPTLKNSCYNGMFSGCTSLKYVKCLATDISATSCLHAMLTGTYGGVFVKHPDNNSYERNENGINNDWAVDNVAKHLYIDDFIGWSLADVEYYLNDEGMGGINDFVLEDCNFTFNNKRYYLYNYNNGELYGLVPEEKSNIFTLERETIIEKTENYLNNYCPFAYILKSDKSELYNCGPNAASYVLVDVGPKHTPVQHIYTDDFPKEVIENDIYKGHATDVNDWVIKYLNNSLGASQPAHDFVLLGDITYQGEKYKEYDCVNDDFYALIKPWKTSEVYLKPNSIKVNVNGIQSYDDIPQFHPFDIVLKEDGTLTYPATEKVNESLVKIS